MTGAILAGGRSRRMRGPDKARLRLDGTRVIERMAGWLRELCGSCVLVAREEQAPEFAELPVDDVYADLFERCGPLGGLYTALEETEDDVFLVACDLPFLERPLLARLAEEFKAQEPKIFALLPRSPMAGSEQVPGQEPWRPEPLCAVWSRHCRRPAYVALEARELSVSAFARQVNARYLGLTPEETAQLRNINTPEDLSAGGAGLDLI